jgi:Sulfotransferase family
MSDAGSPADAYRRIETLLEARARDHPRRSEPAWSDLLAEIEALAGLLRAGSETGTGHEPALRAFYDNPVFVVGHRKTGTTLVLDLLDGHPDLVVLPGESNHFLTFLPRFGGLAPERIAAEAQRWWILRLITPSGIPPFWAAGPPGELGADPYALFSRRLLELSVANRGRDVLGMAAVALHAARAAVGEPVAWVEKTPGQEHEADRILDAYPSARFIHVVRDPRSVAAAIRRLDRETRHETDLVGVGLTVRRSFAAADRNLRQLGEGRYLLLRYEDLVAEPEPSMRRVAAFVGVGWADSLLTPTVGGVEATSNSAWSARKVTGQIEGRRLELWRDELDARSAELISGATRTPARRFGYDLPRPTRPEAIVGIASRRARLAIGSRRRAVQARVQRKIFSSGTSP